MIPYLVLYSALILYCRRLKEKKGHICHYSFWIWGYLLTYFIIPRSPLLTNNRFYLLRGARWFIFQKAWALFWGTQIFWLYDNYDILYQIGIHYTKNKKLVHLGDLAVHGLPLIFAYNMIREKRIYSPSYLSGVFTFLLHFSYSYLLTGGHDVSDMYEIKTTKKNTLRDGWIIFFFSYISGELVLRYISDK